MFHTSVLRTPIGEAIHIDSPLCQSYKNGDKGESYTMPNKLAACGELCKMQGFYEPEKVETTHAFDMGRVIALVNQKKE